MVMEHLPEPYTFGTEGLFCGDQRISSYVIVPRQVYHRPGEESPFCCSLVVRSADGGERALGRYVMLSELTPRWWKTPPAGCWIYPGVSQAGGHLALVFNALLSSLEARPLVCADTLGWQTLPSGRHVYITGTEAIGADDATPILISETLAPFSIDALPDCPPETALQYFWTLWDLVPGVTDVLLTTTLSSFLMPMFQSAGLHTWFSVMLEGPTESKKTTLAVLTSGLYTRRTQPRSCVLSLTSTGTALERRLGQMRHCTVVCDDLFPDGGTAQQNLVRNLIRDQANQTPRESVSGSSIVTYTRKSGLVFTVEKAPLSCRSTDSRCLRLTLEEPVGNEKLAAVQPEAALLGKVWHMFLESAAVRYEELEQFVADEFAKYRRNRLGSSGPERLPEIEAILYIAAESFLHLFPAGDQAQRLDALTEHLNHWGQMSGDRETVFEAIQSIHDTMPDYFSTRWDCWCITRESLTGLLWVYLKDPTLSARTITAMLDQRNALLTDRSGERTKKVNGQRCLCIIPERLVDLE